MDDLQNENERLRAENERLRAKIETNTSYLLNSFLNHYNDRVFSDKRINYDEIEIFMDRLRGDKPS